MIDRRRIASTQLVVCLAVMVAAAVGVTGRGADDPQQSADDLTRLERLTQEANFILGLRASTIVQLDIDMALDQVVFAEVPIEGMIFTLMLSPHSVRSPAYQVLVQGEDGSLVEVDPGPVRTMRGVVLEVLGSGVAASMLEDGLYARVEFPTGDVYWVEPIATRVDGAAVDEYVVVHSDDVLETDGRCGLDENELGNPAQPFDGGDPLAGGDCEPDLYVAELGCDSDVEYFNRWGSVSNVENRINAVINFMNIQYEGDVGITHAISALIVRTAEPDPYSSTDSFTLLGQFRSEWISNQAGVPRDLAHLFTGKNLNGNIIGIAWTLGAVCEFFNQYCLSQSDYNGNFLCATDLSAHELGHLWNADHCGCSNHTMNSFITCANQFHPTFTIPQIVAYRNGLSCLDCDSEAVEAPLTAFAVKKGVLLSGNLGSLVDSDNDYVEIDPVLNNSGTRFITKINVNAKSPHATVAQLDLTIETGIDTSGVKLKVRLRNWDTNRWDQIDSSVLPQSDTEKIYLSIPNPNAYIKNNNSRKVRVRLQTTVKVVNAPDGYVFRIDHVQVDVTP